MLVLQIMSKLYCTNQCHQDHVTDAHASCIWLGVSEDSDLIEPFKINWIEGAAGPDL